MSRLVRLYPRAWRNRYETEFLDLISQRPPSFVERFDIVRGALDARLHPQVQRSVEATSSSPMPDDDLRVARRLGFAAVIGAVLWLAAFAVALMGPVRYDGDGAYRDGSAAMPLFFLGVALLAAGLLGHVIRLPADAKLARGGALLAIPFLLIFSAGPWNWQFGLIAIGLLVVLAVAGLRAGEWPVAATLAVVAACIGVVAIVAVALSVVGGDRVAGGFYFVLAGLVLVPLWLGVGGTLIRQPIVSDASRL